MHDRLLAGATELAGRDGYAQLTVQRVIAASGVSRASFYQYFSNVDDCFRSAYRQAAAQLIADVEAAMRGRRDRELAALDVLVETALRRPQAAQLLMGEGLAAGRAGLAERDALISRLERTIAGSPTHGSSIDLPAAVLIGATFRFLSMQPQDGSAPGDLREQVREWAGSFATESSQASWSRRLAPTPPRQARRPTRQARDARAAGTRRERILRATAASVRDKGYRDVTVTDIVDGAGISRRGFYNEFQSKADASIAAYELAFQQALASCTPAFFLARAWRERVWHGVLACTRFLSREPALAYLGLVEGYALGPGFRSRVHDTQLAFTLFLEDGYRERIETQPLSRACMALTATAICELGFQASRAGSGVDMRRAQPLAVYVALAPFIGSDVAAAFVVGKLAAKGPVARAAA